MVHLSRHSTHLAFMTSSYTPSTKAPEYGSVEYYDEQFSDVLADVGDDDGNKANVLAGLISALTSWINYHDAAACRYEDFAIELNAIVKELVND
jgi:hypothetical protein